MLVVGLLVGASVSYVAIVALHPSLASCALKPDDQCANDRMTGVVDNGVNATGMVIEGGQLSHDSFKQGDFAGTSLMNVNFTDDSFQGANFTNADLVGDDFNGANLTGADFAGADMSTPVKSTGVIGVAAFGGDDSFQCANLSGANFAYADLTGADFSCPSYPVNSTVLEHANLQGAILQYANLSGASLQGAVVTQADFSHASLANANVGEALGTWIGQSGATFCDTMMPDGTVNNSNCKSGGLTSGPPSRPIGYSAIMTRASYNNIVHNPDSVLQADLAMLVSAKVQAIRIDVGYDAWLKGNQTTINEVTNLASSVRSYGLKFVIADAGAEAYRSTPIPWNQFVSAWVQRVTTLARLYHPDYYVVVKEPGWYFPMIQGCRIPVLSSCTPGYNGQAWVSVIPQLVQAVQAVSPSTVIGVAIDAGGGLTNYQSFYDSFLQGAETTSGVSFLGFDIYGQAGLTNTQTFLSTIGSGGLKVWIAETWSSTYGGTTSDADVAWLTQVQSFASANRINWVEPFYTDYFASYSFPMDVQGTVSTFQTQRTQAFYTFQSFAQYGVVS